MPRKLLLASPAARDIDEIFDYVSARSGQRPAQRVLDVLSKAMMKLAENPGLGHRCEDLTQASVQFYRVWSWLIVYRFNDEKLEIARVIHGARDAEAILEGEPS